MLIPAGEVSGTVAAVRLAIAALVGLAVGTEREWSGPPAGPQRRFAGLRTFLLFGLVGGTAGILAAVNLEPLAIVMLLPCGAFVVAAYVGSVRTGEHELHGTTEAAAFVVLGLGLLAGLGYLALAAGSVTVVVLALAEKENLHWIVRRIGREELFAALQFLVLALVILPLLPSGPYEHLLGLRPRALWAVVVVLSGLNFVGYLARKAVGPARGHVVTGLLGGVLSSTLVTLQSSRLSRSEPEHSGSLALGVIAACTVLPLRVLLVTLVLRTELSVASLPYMLPPLAVGAALLVISLRRAPRGAPMPTGGPSPLRLASALKMALGFQVAIIAVAFAQARMGGAAVLGSAALVGVADMDALTVAMTRLTDGPDVLRIAAHGIAIGALASTGFKMILSMLGSAAFRRRAIGGLAAMGVTLLLATWWRW
jgi:uncharacterized membrane protein (DUF4010 family)